MDARQRVAISRKYRHLPLAKFVIFNEGVHQALIGNEKIPATTWGSNPNLLPVYFEISDKYNVVFHEAAYGSSLAIAQRDILQQQLVNCLDEIAADLEAEAVRNPDILLFCGFELSKERRSHNRKKTPVIAEGVATGEHSGDNR